MGKPDGVAATEQGGDPNELSPEQEAEHRKVVDQIVPQPAWTPDPPAATERPKVCPRCHGVDPFAEGVSDLRKRCTPLTCDAWTFTARLTKQGPKPIRRDGRADLRLT